MGDKYRADRPACAIKQWGGPTMDGENRALCCTRNIQDEDGQGENEQIVRHATEKSNGEARLNAEKYSMQ